MTFNILTSIFLLVLLVQLTTLRKLIYNAIYNNVYELLSDLMYETFGKIEDTEAGRTFRMYLRKQRDEIYSRYLEVKGRGRKTLKNTDLITDLKSYVKTDFLRQYNFNELFCDKIEEIINVGLNRLIETMYIDSRRNFRKTLKTNLLLFYKKMLNDMFFVYQQHYLNVNVVFRNSEKFDLITFGNSASIEKKEVLKKLAVGEIKEIIIIFQAFPLSEKQRNSLIMISSRYANYEHAKLIGTGVDDTELREITNSMITFVNQL